VSKLTALVEASFVEPSEQAKFLATMAPHSGDWLLALLIASCGFQLDDEAVRVAVGMRLGLSLKCSSGSNIDAQGLHTTLCEEAPAHMARHQVINDII